MNRYAWRAVALTMLGLVAMTGDVLGSQAMQGVGLATSASPRPKVFTTLKGLEGFSSRFFIEWTLRDGSIESHEMTPAIYQRLNGPYNRRNVYGAAMAGGPFLVSEPLTEPLWTDVMLYAFCGDAPALRELGLDGKSRVGPVRVRIEPRDGAQRPELPLVLEAPCLR